MSLMKKEIQIVGAGLSGLTAGINLAKAGYKVKIFEKNDVVGKRFHGDYQGIENWIYSKDALEHIQDLGVKTNFPNYPVKAVKIISSSGKVSNIESKNPLFYLVRRGTEENTLDQNLYR